MIYRGQQRGERMAQRAIPLGENKALGGEGKVRSSWLIAIGTIGVLLVGGAIALETWVAAGSIWAAVLLELGAGTLLFTLLFMAERHLVRRATTQLISALTPEDLSHLTGERSDTHIRQTFATGGPVDIAYKWLEAAASGDYETMWRLSDHDWQTSRIQAWLWNGRDNFGYSIPHLESLLTAMRDGSAPDLWDSFVRSERRQYQELFYKVDVSKLGASDRRRRVAPDYELILIIELEGHKSGFKVEEPLVIPSRQFLMHRVGKQWLFANFNTSCPPTPGWPPGWWMAEDPAVLQYEAEKQAQEPGPS